MNYKNIPHPVLKAAKHLINHYGERLVLIGSYANQEVYVFSFPDDVETGFPFLYLLDEKKQTAREITGSETLDLIGKLQ